VVHLDPVNHTRGGSVAKSDRSLAILTGDDEIPVSWPDFRHGDLPMGSQTTSAICFVEVIVAHLTFKNETGTIIGSSPTLEAFMDADKRNEWLRRLDAECPYQVVLPRRQLADDSEIMDFLIADVGKFDMYVEDDYAAFVRYCFADPADAAVFRSRFEPKAERPRLAG
jgi:hypothetical protein